MDDIRKLALKFICDNDLQSLNYSILENALDRLGFDIIRFNKKDPETIAMFRALKLNDSTIHEDCFTYVNGTSRHIFLAKYLSEKEYVFMLLHEIGHIELKHLIQDNTYVGSLNEVEANEFAFEVKRHIRHIKISRRINKILVFLIAGAILYYSAWKILKNYNTSNSSSFSDVQSSFTDLAVDEIFYVTPSGKKYHKDFCSAIKDKDKDALFFGTREELKKMGYEPCKLCIGENSEN